MFPMMVDFPLPPAPSLDLPKISLVFEVEWSGEAFSTMDISSAASSTYLQSREARKFCSDIVDVSDHF